MKYFRIWLCFFICIHFSLLSSECGFIKKKRIEKDVVKFSELYRPCTPEYLYHFFDHYSDQETLNSYFRVQRIYNFHPGNKKKVISYSLFWKMPFLTQESVVVNRQTIHEVRPHRMKGRSFYELYCAPLLQSIRDVIPRLYPGWVVRIYLANDLAFLIEDYFRHFTHVEVFLMESNSLAHSPGSMWRFLAFDDVNAEMVMIRDSDEVLDATCEKRAKHWIETPWTKGLFRDHNPAPYAIELESKDCIAYSPLVARVFGGKEIFKYINMEKAMKGFIAQRITFPDAPRYERDAPEKNHPYGFGNEFPSYGFDERFLKHVVYFLMTEQSLLKTLPRENFLPRNYKLSNGNPVLSDYYWVISNKRRLS